MENEFIIDQNYYVDLKKDKFKRSFEKINIVFNSNYLNFIRNVTDPVEKEIYILMRKYQYYFNRITLNENILFSIENNSEETNTNSINLVYDKENVNCFLFEINLLPKFKKNEINFTIPNDILECSFSIYFTIDEKSSKLNFTESKITINNIKEVLEITFYSNLCEELENNLCSFLKNYQNLFQGFNKFIVYMENYFPAIYKKAIENYNVKKDIWSQEEQNKLEEALIKFKEEKEHKEKFKKISDYIKTKSISECVNRYKKLASIAKKANKDSTIASAAPKDITKVSENVKVIKPEPVLVPIIEKVKPIIKADIIIHPQVKKEKKKEQIHVKNVPEVDALPDNTLDLVDELLNQFNSLYGGTLPGNDNVDNPVTNQDKEDEEKEDLNENYYYNEEFEEEDSENENEAEDVEKEKVDLFETLDDFVIKNEQMGKQISPNEIYMLKNVFLFGEKASIRISGLKITNVALAEINDPCLLIKCNRCKQSYFPSRFIILNPIHSVYYCGAQCPKCNTDIYTIFIADILHSNNLVNAGTIFCTNGLIMDILPSGFLVNCFKCPETYKKIKLHHGGFSAKDKQCKTCGGEMGFHLSSIHIVNSSYSNNYSLDNLNIIHFQKYTVNPEEIEVDKEYVKKFDKIIQQGKPLPDKGICVHYKHSFRWFRFSCCNKLFPCDLCHDEVSDHKNEFAKRILCGFCAFDQQSINIVCEKCASHLKHNYSGAGFWEGGKGVRDKLLMSNKDAHKFKNSVVKTISKKKEKEIKKK